LCVGTSRNSAAAENSVAIGGMADLERAAPHSIRLKHRPEQRRHGLSIAPGLLRPRFDRPFFIPIAWRFGIRLATRGQAMTVSPNETDLTKINRAIQPLRGRLIASVTLPHQNEPAWSNRKLFDVSTHNPGRVAAQRVRARRGLMTGSGVTRDIADSSWRIMIRPTSRDRPSDAPALRQIPTPSREPSGVRPVRYRGSRTRQRTRQYRRE
jgi:hypothetical protein